MPNPLVALPWGSMSTRRTRLPCKASPAARFTEVVVLPTPPFWLATATILAMVQQEVRGCSTWNIEIMFRQSPLGSVQRSLGSHSPLVRKKSFLTQRGIGCLLKASSSFLFDTVWLSHLV